MRQIQPRWEGFALAAEETPPRVYHERRETLETPVDDSEEDPSPSGSSEWNLESERASIKAQDGRMEDTSQYAVQEHDSRRQYCA